jgi:hypothetical protein
MYVDCSELPAAGLFRSASSDTAPCAPLLTAPCRPLLLLPVAPNYWSLSRVWTCSVTSLYVFRVYCRLSSQFLWGICLQFCFCQKLMSVSSQVYAFTRWYDFSSVFPIWSGVVCVDAC